MSLVLFFENKGKSWYEINEKIKCVLDAKESWKIEKYMKKVNNK